ncbi:hypothetical protein M8R50_01875 [Enterobacter bugandensis]|uniref:hypothetical protein n=1 Tax=Enterobacter bugandensis TaxID=881260 RepID=UPI002075B9CD|nr:hypothetical protein [Enterobacter bugandensis]MCM7236044.1 hypothetical protein [Enterobacter bugandensis]MCM7316119.1 hypothetical protein [Enterobacter bugandensis]MCM7351673.1 hypothetical protein [Enterobacter bugandensis]
MAEATKTTIRLKKQEAVELKDAAFSLTKQAIMKGKQKIYTEADLAHFAIENLLKYIDIDDSGNLILNIHKSANNK